MAVNIGMEPVERVRSPLPPVTPHRIAIEVTRRFGDRYWNLGKSLFKNGPFTWKKYLQIKDVLMISNDSSGILRYI